MNADDTAATASATDDKLVRVDDRGAVRIIALDRPKALNALSTVLIADLAAALRDAGMEVVYTGLRQTPEAVVRAALEEDVDAVGVSILSGAHGTVLPRLRALLDADGLGDVVLVAGGTIPDADGRALVDHGTVGRVFTPGTPLADAVGYVRTAVAARRAQAEASDG